MRRHPQWSHFGDKYSRSIGFGQRARYTHMALCILRASGDIVASSVHQLNTLLTDLRAVVVQMEPLKRRAAVPAVITQKLVQLSHVAEELKLTYSDYPQEQWKNLVAALDGFRTTITHELASRRDGRSTQALKAKLADRYEHILYSIRSIPDLRKVAEKVQTLRPTTICATYTMSETVSSVS